MHFKVSIIGVRGSGKSYIMKKLRILAPNYGYVIGSEVLRKLAGDEFKNFNILDKKKKEQYRYLAIKELEKMAMEKPLIVEGHLSFYNPEQDKMDLVQTEADSNFNDAYILLHPTIELVQSYRSKDRGKMRILDEEIIKQEIDTELQEFYRTCKNNGHKGIKIDLPCEENLALQILKSIEEITND